MININQETSDGRKRELEGAMEIVNTGPYRREDVERLLLEGQKTKRKLQKVQQRRDHYARLYYQALMELDMTKLELSRAHQEISELKGQVARQLPCASNGKLGVGSNTTSPDSGASVSPGQGIIDGAVFSQQQHPPGPTSRANAHTLCHTSHTPDAPSWPHTQDMEVQLRAPMGCSAFAHPRFRRSLSLSQQETAFVPHLLVAGTKSYRTHKPLRAANSLQHSSPAELAGSLLATTTLQHPHPAESAGAPMPAFKQFSSPERSCLSQPIPPPLTHAGIQPSNLVCDREVMKFESLSSNELLTVYCQLSSLTCPVLKLELANCQLGQAHNMKLFCKYLMKNKSIEELSLPGNGITLDSLSLLLDSIQQCLTIKELLLRNNMIGHECASKIKEFLAGATLDSLVLTGNDIERYSHLLDGSLPSDFAMEYGPRRDTSCSVESADSGLPPADPTDTAETTDTTDNEHNSFPLQSAFKYLRI